MRVHSKKNPMIIIPSDDVIKPHVENNMFATFRAKISIGFEVKSPLFIKVRGLVLINVLILL